MNAQSLPEGRDFCYNGANLTHESNEESQPIAAGVNLYFANPLLNRGPLSEWDHFAVPHNDLVM